MVSTEDAVSIGQDGRGVDAGGQPNSGHSLHFKHSCCGVDGICYSIMCYPFKLGVKFLYWVLAAITSIVAVLVLIAACLEVAIVFEFDAVHTGNAVAFIILAVTAIGSIVLSIWGAYLICCARGSNSTLRVAAGLLVVMLVLQVLIVAFVALPSRADEQGIVREMVISFNEAKVKANYQNKWASTQNSFKCCGIFGPEDYRTSGQAVFFPPDVHVSCCPGYDSRISPSLQEREREICKARREYFVLGCKDPVLSGFKELGLITIGIVATLGLLQLIEILLFSLIKRKSKEIPIEQSPKL